MSNQIEISLARLDAKLEVILTKLEVQQESTKALNEIIWRSNGTKPSLIELTERQEGRIATLEETTQKRLDFMQGILLALIPVLATSLFALLAATLTNENPTIKLGWVDQIAKLKMD